MNEDYEDTEQAILNLIRRLRLFDKLEVSYSKEGELTWKLTRSDRSRYTYLTINDTMI